MTTTMTRRRLLGRVPAVAATLMAPSVATALSGLPTAAVALFEPDPVFAVIAEYWAAERNWFLSNGGQWFKEPSLPILLEAERPDRKQAGLRLLAADKSVRSVVPTTVKGAAAWLRLIADPTVPSGLPNELADQMIAIADMLDKATA